MGEAGEAAACALLEASGLHIIATDWRCRRGQIDIVATDGDVLVIVEVKARRGTGFGLPQEAVDRRKQARLRDLAEVYRAATGRTRQAVRIDVVAVLVDNDMNIRSIEHIRNAVED